MNAENKTDVNRRMCFTTVTNLVTGWTLDFMFISLCRHFKEGNLDKFNETISTFEGISHSPAVKGEHQKKVLICAFLARVMHGKMLDVEFEEEARVMPLMSAAQVWSDLKSTVADESLFKSINTLLFIQSVAMCLEKGKRSSAFSALTWFENNLECPKNVKVQLSAIVTNNETHHPVLKSFSYSHLLTAIQCYLDAYLEMNPSDYLLKAATEMAQSSQDTECSGDSATQDGSLSEPVNNSAGNKKSKKKLMSTKIDDLWVPDTCKKPCISLRRISLHEVSQMMSKKRDDASTKMESQIKKRKKPQKWTSKLDKYLEQGVKRHGPGKWSRILLDYDFEGRTGVMLKDRWRVLVKSD